MTQEEKQLLLTDLCARLLYKPVCHAGKINHDGNLYFINIIYSTVAITSDKAVGKFETCPIVDVKPYLRPMSSMTEEESAQLSKIINNKVKVLNKIQHLFRQIKSILNDKANIYPNVYEWSKKESEKLTKSLDKIKLDDIEFDFLNAHHFDYRGLIPMGLALEAPEGMYKAE